MFISNNMTYSYRFNRSDMWTAPQGGHIADGSPLWTALQQHHGAQVLYRREGYPAEVYTWDAHYYEDGSGRWVGGDDVLL